MNLLLLAEDAGIDYQNSEGVQLATITEAQLWDFAQAFLTQCQQAVLNCRVVYTNASGNPEEFEQWNHALNTAVHQLTNLLDQQ